MIDYQILYSFSFLLHLFQLFFWNSFLSLISCFFSVAFYNLFASLLSYPFFTCSSTSSFSSSSIFDPSLLSLHHFLIIHCLLFYLYFEGKYKRTMTPFKPTTEDARDKVSSEIHEILRMFKMFITSHRPSLNVDEVATGEVRTCFHLWTYIHMKFFLIHWFIC